MYEESKPIRASVWIWGLYYKFVGVMIIGLGLYYISNCFSCIFFGTEDIWSDWYAGFVGYTLDLWIMAVPIVGMPLLFEKATS